MPDMAKAFEATPVAKPIPKGSNLPAIKYRKAHMGFKIGSLAAFLTALPLLILVCWPGVYGHPPSEGFVLAEVNMLSRYDDKHPEKKHPTYEITGKIVNTSEHTLLVPTLRISVIDEEGNTLQFWDVREKDRMLEPNKNIPFSTGPLNIKFNHPDSFIVELGSKLELSLRSKPE